MPAAITSAAAATAGAGVASALALYAASSVTNVKAQLQGILDRLQAVDGDSLATVMQKVNDFHQFDPSSILASLSSANSAIKALQDKVEALAQEQGTKAAAATAAAKVIAVSSSSSLDAVVQSVAAKVSGHDGDISALQSALRNLQTSYDTLKSLYTEVASRTGLPASVADASQVVAATLTAAEKSDITTRLRALETDTAVSKLMSRVTATESSLAWVVSDISTAINNNNINSGVIDTVAKSLSALDAYVTTSVKPDVGKAAALAAADVALGGRIDAVVANVGTDTTTGTVKFRLAGAETNIAAISKYINGTLVPQVNSMIANVEYSSALTRVLTVLQCEKDLKLVSSARPTTLLSSSGSNVLAASAAGQCSFRFGASDTSFVDYLKVRAAGVVISPGDTTASSILGYTASTVAASGHVLGAPAGGSSRFRFGTSTSSVDSCVVTGTGMTVTGAMAVSAGIFTCQPLADSTTFPTTFLGFSGGTAAQQGNYLSAPAGGATRFRFASATKGYVDVAAITETDIVHGGTSVLGKLADLEARLAKMEKNITGRFHPALAFAVPPGRYTGAAYVSATSGASYATITPLTSVLRIEGNCVGYVSGGSGSDYFWTKLVLRVGTAAWNDGVHSPSHNGRTDSWSTSRMMNAWTVTPGVTYTLGVLYMSATDDTMEFVVRDLCYFFE